MRILAICGSPRGRQSITKKLIENVLEGAKTAGAEVELVDLGETSFSYCKACNACHVVGKCPIKDDFPALREKLLACDGLVLGSPNYFNSVTAQLKTVLDRLSGEIHCQEYLGKYGCCVATAGGAEYDIVNDYLSDVLLRLGCSSVGAVGATLAVPGLFERAQEEAIALGKNLVQAIQEKRSYPDQEPTHKTMHERFKMLITFNKDNWPYEYDHWRAKGWL